MPELLIKCPKCSRISGTGISMDHSSFYSSTLMNNKINCKNCGKIITWNKEDVLETSFTVR